MLRHCPVSYKANQLTKQSSLGILDNACKRLQIFLKKSATSAANQKDFRNQIEFLISCFEHQNNFCLEAEATGIIPAYLHLGMIRTTNILSLMQNIQRIAKPESQNMLKMQELLINARTVLQAGENTAQKVQNQQARQLKQHGKLKNPGDIIDQIQPLDVLFVKSELKGRPKMSFFVNFHGPCLVLGVQPKSEHLIIFGLLSSEVMIKNFKQVRFAFSKELFSIPFFPHLGDQIQFRIFSPRSRISGQDGAQNVITNTTKIILNLHKVFTFLAPLLPSYKETKGFLRTVTLSLGDDKAHHDDDGDGGDDDDRDHQNGRQVDGPDIGNDNTRIYMKPTVSFDPSTKPDADDDDGGDGQGVHDEDDEGGNGRPTVQLHGRAPSTDNIAPENRNNQPSSKEITFSRPKIKPAAPLERQQKYNLRSNPQPSRKYQ